MDFASYSSDISYRKSIDGGVTFTSTENLSDTPGGSTFADIALSGNIVRVAWDDNSLGYGDEIFHRNQWMVELHDFSDIAKFEHDAVLDINPL